MSVVQPYIQGPVRTGNLLVAFRPSASPKSMMASLRQTGHAQIAARSDFDRENFSLAKALDNADGALLDEIGVAVIKPSDAAMSVNGLRTHEDVIATVPEFYAFALDWEARRNRWLQEGLALLIEGQRSTGTGLAMDLGETAVAAFQDDADSTWGLKATGVTASTLTGKGVRIAVLDTGFALGHPAFAGRSLVAKSMIAGILPEDVQGHGTHCVGTAAGPFASVGKPRYGVAPEADIFVYKVLGDDGRGTDGDILAGIENALVDECAVISMSLGRPASPGDKPNAIYEAVAQKALSRGSLIIAAAGNESMREGGYIAPVGYPANSPSIMAVAAVDSLMQVASFSCGAINGGGGEVDIAAPGVHVLSSVPMPQETRRLSGTSMATPHVAGIAALFAQKNRRLRGKRLWDALVAAAKPLPLKSSDVGAGLVQAP